MTYRIVDLLFNEETSAASTKERVAEVVQHELAHQWFGNLVTMDWWEGLWLNEGFATWMSWYSCDRFYPEWKVWEAYVTVLSFNTLTPSLSFRVFGPLIVWIASDLSGQFAKCVETGWAEIQPSD